MDFELARQKMVQEQLVARGIRDRHVLAAMLHMPRHAFVDSALAARAYEDGPLPTESGQTISQPYMVARMTEVLGLKGTERLLEIGTGSGYQTAILAELCAFVVSVERHPGLANTARERLRRLGYADRVEVVIGDGNLGYAPRAPYDGILLTAAAQRIPRPLVDQLRLGGVLVLPLGEEQLQGLTRIRKTENGLQTDYLGECSFVKLIGEYGWDL